jgi:hypothetical protein
MLGSVSKFMGRHSPKFGLDYRIIHTDFTNNNYAAGDFRFNRVFTGFNPPTPGDVRDCWNWEYGSTSDAMQGNKLPSSIGSVSSKNIEGSSE